MWTLTGFVYVAFVVDVFSHRILGWTVSGTRTVAPGRIGPAAGRIAARERKDLCHRNGFGPSWRCGLAIHRTGFAKELRESGIAGSIGTVGDALDNALMESAIGLFKIELIDRHPNTWRDRFDVERAVAAWVRWFNHTRLHSSIGYLPPGEFEQHHATPKTADLEPEAA